MGITHSFNEPYFTGTTARLQLVPGLFDISLGGRTYMLDLASGEFRHESIPLLRAQADDSRSPSEVSINPEDLWRRSHDTWHKGAGQDFFDRADSDPARFQTSKGVNVWERWELSLLNDTSSVLTSTNTNLHFAVANPFFYTLDGSDILRSDDITIASPVFAQVTGTYTVDPITITTDGFNIYTNHGTDGIFKSERTSVTTASFVTGNVNGVIAYVKNRLIASNNNEIFNPIAAGALPAALFSHDNTDFRWVGFAEGTGHIYAAGFSGSNSEIYRTAVQADGTALDVPVVAGELPDGEIVRSIQGYLGFIIIGTDLGARFAAPDANGDLVLGALIETDNPVTAFEPQDRFVWYGLTDFDGSSTGVGRLDLSTFTAPLTPAFASDLMATGQGTVLSITTFQDRTIFSVAGLGIFVEQTTPVSSGTIESGRIWYGLSNPKMAMFLDIVHSHTGELSVELSVDNLPFFAIATHAEHGAESPHTTSFPIQREGQDFEHRITLTAVDDVSPIISAITLRAFPQAPMIRFIFVPILLHETVRLRNGTDHTMDPQFEFNHITSLRQLKSIVSYIDATEVHTVVVEDFDYRPHHRIRNGLGWNATCLTKIKVLSDG